jgi:hypothetical protein
MDAAQIWCSPEASQPIGDDLTTSCRGLLCRVCDDRRGEGGYLGEILVNGVASISKGDSDDRDLVL